MTPSLRFQSVQSRHDLQEFLDVPAHIYRNDPNWVRPLDLDQKTHLSPKNPFFEHAEVRLRMARDPSGRAVGRMSTQVDSLAPAYKGGKVGNFGLLEAESPEVMQALFADGEEWLREKGVQQVLGPFSLSVNDESGLLVDGFDSPPRLMMNYAQSWYGDAIEAAGYKREKDLLSFLVDLEKEVPPGARRMAEQAHDIPGFKERGVDMKRFDEELLTVGRIFNDAWSNNWGFVPLTDAEIRHLGKTLKPVVDRDLARFIQVQGKDVGMIITLADFNEALIGLNGRLSPFGWAKLLWRAKVKNITTGRALLMGVTKEWQQDVRNAAMIAAMFLELRRQMLKKHFKKLELSWVLEDNRPTVALAKLFGSIVEKRYRIYSKKL